MMWFWLLLTALFAAFGLIWWLRKVYAPLPKAPDAPVSSGIADVGQGDVEESPIPEFEEKEIGIVAPIEEPTVEPEPAPESDIIDTPVVEEVVTPNVAPIAQPNMAPDATWVQRFIEVLLWPAEEPVVDDMPDAHQASRDISLNSQSKRTNGRFRFRYRY